MSWIKNTPALNWNAFASAERRSEPPLIRSSQSPLDLKVNIHERMGSSAPQRFIGDYAIHKVSPRCLFSVSLPAHLESSEGKVAQLLNITGPDFYCVDNYDHYTIRINLRIPLLESLFADAKHGKGIPSVLELRKNREEFIESSDSKDSFRGVVGEAIFYYLNLLLCWHRREVPDIQKLALYPIVKDALVEYWDCLVRPIQIAKISKEEVAKILGQSHEVEGQDSKEKFDHKCEEQQLQKLEEALGKIDVQYHIETSFSNQNLVNMLRDILCLYSGGSPETVTNSLPYHVKKFLDRKFGPEASKTS